jgi:molecular chaperone HscB
MPPEFLEEVIELREALMEADLAQAQKMAADVEKRKAAALKEAIDALGALPEPRPSSAGAGPAAEASPELKKASHALARVRYFDRFLEQVAAMEEEAL